MNDDDIVLSELADEELVEQMHDDLYDGLADEIAEGTQILLDRGWGAKKVLDEALVGGMNIVGIDFRDGILFVPEVLLAANAMKAGMAILQPILSETGAEPVGKMVIGTVKGDIHDIGKNLVGMMMEGAGFEVIDLGINNDVEAYLAALDEHLGERALRSLEAELRHRERLLRAQGAAGYPARPEGRLAGPLALPQDAVVDHAYIRAYTHAYTHTHTCTCYVRFTVNLRKDRVPRQIDCKFTYKSSDQAILSLSRGYLEAILSLSRGYRVTISRLS